MRYKLAKSYFHPVSGASCVVISTKHHGKFCGMAHFNPNDEDEKISRFFGCQIAEHRAVINYLRARIKTNKIKMKALQDYHNSIKGTRSYDEKLYIVKMLKVQISELHEQIELDRKNIKAAKDRIAASISARYPTAAANEE